MTPGSALLAPLWRFLASCGEAASTTKEGAGVDPSGLSAPSPTSPSDAGAGVDPSGIK